MYCHDLQAKFGTILAFVSKNCLTFITFTDIIELYKQYDKESGKTNEMA
jgi:hypothetical protein